MKKRVLLGGVLFVALCVLAGIGYFGKKMNINFIETETREAPKKEDKAEKKEQLERETLYEEILNHCTADFIGEKPINDNFLSWLHSAYGEEVIEEIAKESKKSRQDRNLWYSLTGNSIQVLWIQYCRDTGYQLELLENVYQRRSSSILPGMSILRRAGPPQNIWTSRKTESMTVSRRIW